MTDPAIPITTDPPILNADQCGRLALLSLTWFETLAFPQLVEEIASLNPILISDEAAALISELLTAHDCGPEEPATFVGLRTLLTDPGPRSMVDPVWTRQLQHRAAATAIALGLHLDDNGWMLRVLLEDPDDIPGPEWEGLLAELDRRAQAELAQ